MASPSATMFDRLIVLVKRADSPFTRALKNALRRLTEPRVLRIPRIFSGALRALYELHFLIIQLFRFAVTTLYRGPLFQARCASFGKDVVLDGPMPFVSGHAEIHIGDNCYIGGKVFISTARLFDNPKLIVGKGCSIGWNTAIIVNREGHIRDDVWLPVNCRDAHC